MTKLNSLSGTGGIVSIRSRSESGAVRTADAGIRILVRQGWDLLAVIIGKQANNEAALSMLCKEGIVIAGASVVVMDEAVLDYKIPLAIMPCSYVSGFTARLAYGDASKEVSRIQGRPDLCVYGGVAHLTSLIPDAEARHAESLSYSGSVINDPSFDREREFGVSRQSQVKAFRR